MIIFDRCESKNCYLWSIQSNAPDPNFEKQMFLVPHPFQPFYGKEFEIIECRYGWNEALRTVTELKEKFECVITENENYLTSDNVKRIHKLVEDFPAVWNDPLTSAKERKRMVRLLIEDVTLLKTDVIHVKVRFKGGDSMEMCVPIPPAGWKVHQTSTEVIERIRKMARTKMDSEITDKLNKQQLRSSTGLSFTSRRVYMLRRDYDIAGPYEHLREQGFLTAEELADRIGVYSGTVKKWGKAGILKSRPYNDRGMVLYEDPGENLPNKWAKKKYLTLRSKFIFRTPLL